MNRVTGLCLKSHVLRNKLISKAYDVLLASPDECGEYQEWLLDCDVHEGQEVFKLG